MIIIVAGDQLFRVLLYLTASSEKSQEALCAVAELNRSHLRIETFHEISNKDRDGSFEAEKLNRPDYDSPVS